MKTIITLIACFFCFNLFAQNNALSFDGIDDQVVIASGISLSDRSFTVEFYAKRSGTGRFDMVYSQGNSNPTNNNALVIGFRSNNKFTFGFYGNDLDYDASQLQVNSWHHWACTFDNVTKVRTIYLDGIAVANDVSPSAFLPISSQTIIGNATFGGQNFKGSVDELRIWNRALGRYEISNRYNYSIDLTYGLRQNIGLIGYYKFNQVGLVNYVTDSSPENNPGTGQNFLFNQNPWVTGVVGSVFWVEPATSSVTSYSPVSGPAGTKVSVSGQNLSTTTAVNIGKKPAASFTVLSSNSVEAISADTVAQPVIVTTAFNTAAYTDLVNDDINYEVLFVKGSGNLGSGLYNDYAIKVDPDADGVATNLLSYVKGAVNHPAYCYQYSGAAGIPVSGAILYSEVPSKGKSYDVDVLSWNSASSDCNFDGTDVAAAHAGDVKYLTANKPNSFTAYDITPKANGVSNGATASLKHIWRYAHGDESSDPLDFGIVSNTTKQNINSNRPAPDGATDDMGYKSNSVNYNFELSENSVVKISTNYPETNFNTYVGVRGITNSNVYYFNDDSSATNGKSVLIHNLCKGKYYLFVSYSSVSPLGGATLGDFKISVTATPYTPDAGTIKLIGSNIIPNPQEDVPDSLVTNTTDAKAGLNAGIVWQKKTGVNGTWGYSDTTNRQSYLLPVNLGTFNGDVYYRRTVTDPAACAADVLSNEVLIKIVKNNGGFSGKVTSKTGSGVKGVKITLQKKKSLPGSPASYQYSTLTGDDGSYSISPVYYSVDPESANDTTTYIITPSKDINHVFNFPYLEKTLSKVYPQQSADFTDQTVFSITGRTVQVCDTCADVNGATALRTCPEDSVQIYNNNTYTTLKTRYDSVFNDYGRYAVSVDQPGKYVIEPRFNNHVFNPASVIDTVINNINNPDFKDITTYSVSGRVTAGCNDYIGQAVLEFSDVLPNDSKGNARSSCFRKRVTTILGSGFYNVRLPARKYKVRVISFTASADVSSPDFKDFFDNKYNQDSLVRDITTNDATLNLVYQRPPAIVFQGLDTMKCTGWGLMQQGVTDSFTVAVFQGNPVKGCYVPNDTTIVELHTNLQDATQDPLSFKTTNGIAKVKLMPGTPNIAYPYTRDLEVFYKDKYKRTDAYLPKKVVVTGVKVEAGTFTTVSPQIPLMVLHAPPGDASYSSFTKGQTIESAMRFYAGTGDATKLWSEVKLGVKFDEGIFISTEEAFWEQYSGSFTTTSKINRSSEAIVTNTLEQSYSTGVGAFDGGDVFIGAALNIKYAPSTEIAYDPAACAITQTTKVIFAPQSGVNTNYVYTEAKIKNEIIPLLDLAISTEPNVVTKNGYVNQKNVWQQLLDNNNANKKNAKFDKNISFDGKAGPITTTATSSSSLNNTIEFALEIEKEIAIEAGLEIGGSGAKGGVTVNFKMETGGSSSQSVLNTTTTSYTLDDDDDEKDSYSVDVKKDPVYNTPVFALYAATSSCPHEDGTQPRTDMEFSATPTKQSNVDPATQASFSFKISNTSPTREKRTFRLKLNPESNPDGATVYIGGSPATKDGISYDIDYLATQSVNVRVAIGDPTVFSYQGLQFTVSDDCDPNLNKKVSVSVDFQSPCSNITLVTPESNWVNAKADNNLVPILFKDYTINNLNSVSLEYSKSTLNNWTNAFTLTKDQVTNSVNGTATNWNVSGIPDGNYKVRMKVGCSNGTKYSASATGVIDRTPPVMIGKPQPSDDSYVIGDVISATYSESIDCQSLSSSNIVIKRVSNGDVVPAQLGCYQNRISVVPLVNVAAFKGDALTIKLQDIPDLYGNTNSVLQGRGARSSAVQDANVWNVAIGNSIPATGSKVLKLSVVNPVINEDASGTINFTFTLPDTAATDMLINYTVAGTATPTTDYTVSYLPVSQPVSASFTGAQSTIVMKRGTKTAILQIDPVADATFEPNEIITVSLNSGGDYLLSDSTVATGTIVNDDAAAVYTFTGSGDWTNANNWVNKNVPPTIVPEGVQIVIDPSGVCVLNSPLTLMKGAKITVRPGKIFQNKLTQ